LESLDLTIIKEFAQEDGALIGYYKTNVWVYFDFRPDEWLAKKPYK